MTRNDLRIEGLSNSMGRVYLIRTMYTIKEASARTGVGTSLIRAWERRYGVVKPTRAASGYRLYDDATLQVLLAMRLLVESGWTASEAARAIGAGEVALDEIAGEPVAAGIPSTTVDAHRAHLIARFIDSAAAASTAGTEAALDEILASGSFEGVIDDLVLPAAAALGDAWLSGRLSVAAEHAASAAVARRLGAAYQAAGVPGRTTVVVGLPPGSRHELGALAFAVALRRRGVGVLDLGQDVTVEGWVDAATRTRAKAAVEPIQRLPQKAEEERALCARRPRCSGHPLSHCCSQVRASPSCPRRRLP